MADVNDDIEFLKSTLGENVLITPDNILDDGERSSQVIHVTENEVRDIERKVDKLRRIESEKASLGFFYVGNCKLCQIAYNDPDLHRVLVEDNLRPRSVIQYCKEVHGLDVKHNSVRSHIDKHFLPKYKEMENNRRNYRLAIHRGMKEREKHSLPFRMAEQEEILIQLQENIMIKSESLLNSSDRNDLREYTNCAKVISQLAGARNTIWTTLLKVMGMDQSPEESQNFITNLVSAKIEQALNKLPEEEKRKFIMLMQNAVEQK